MAICVSAANSLAADDLQLWPSMTVKFGEYRGIEFLTYGEMRLTDDVSEATLYMISPKIRYRLNDYLSLGMNYSHLEFKASDPRSGERLYFSQDRAELEVNPSWQLASWIKLNMRNRLELRWTEGVSTTNVRSRHRLETQFPIESVSWLKYVYANSEFFYDWSNSRYSENRTVPFGASFGLRPKTSLQVFYMIRSVKARSWQYAHVIGTNLNVSF